jgi:hypothetical protein
VLVALAACGGGGGQSPAAAKSEITAVWTSFFSDHAAPVDTKVSQVEEGASLRTTLEASANDPTARTLSAHVTTVVLPKDNDCPTPGVRPPCAKVTYDLLGANGVALLRGASGYAVRRNGHWVVAKSTICTLYSLQSGGRPVPGCTA